MTDPRTDYVTESLNELPIQPTGSGVADLEIAYEQMKLAEAREGGTAADDGAADERIAGQSPLASTDPDIAETAAHPS